MLAEKVVNVTWKNSAVFSDVLAAISMAPTKDLFLILKVTSHVRGESHVDVRTQCGIMTLAGEEGEGAGILPMTFWKWEKLFIEFQSLWIVVYCKINFCVLLTLLHK